MKDPLDLESLQLPDQPNNAHVLVRRKRLPHPKRGKRFLKGPIPCRWLQLAARQPGKALHTGVVLWYKAGLIKRNEVKLTRSLLGEFGVLPDAGNRALRRLEEVGLVSVVRHRGRSPVVTILDGPDR